MKFKRILLIGMLCMLFANISMGQTSKKDQRITQPLIHFDFGASMFGGDHAGRTDIGMNLGGGFMVKSKENYIYDLDFTYYWSDNLNQPYSLFPNLVTSNGLVIDRFGTNGAISTSLRSFAFMAKFGKIFYSLKKNPNSGFFGTFGVGYQTSYFYINAQEDLVPQLSNDYAKGYDRLRGGVSLSQAIGFMHFDERNLLNYIIQFEVKENFAQPLREYDMGLGKKDTNSYKDLYFGLKVSWMFTFKKKVKDFYFD